MSSMGILVFAPDLGGSVLCCGKLARGQHSECEEDGRQEKGANF